MCTSTASKPARSKAAAISIWPLTPCSRRMATRGRAAARDERRGDVLVEVERHDHRDQAAVGRRRCGSPAPRRRSRDRRAATACGRWCPTRCPRRRLRARLDTGRRGAPPMRIAVLGGQPGDRRARARGSPAAANVWRTAATSAARTSSTAPAPRRTAAPADPGRPRRRASADRSMSSPTPPANAISSSVTSRPPSERSW